MYFYCLSYTDHTYNSFNKQPKGTVSVLVIPTTLTIVLINNQTVLLLSSSYTDHTYNNLNKQSKGTVIVLVIPTTNTII